MKQIYVICFFLMSFLCHSQYQQFQLELVDANVGGSVWAGCSGCSYETNDEGLNVIFQNHNVVYYQDAHVFSFEIEELIQKIHLLACEACDANQFLEDLNNYSTVVRLANPHSENGYFYNGLSLKLVDATVGIPTGAANGIVITNNTALNQIFINNNVSIYKEVDIGTSYQHYELLCDCEASLLKDELDSLDDLISSIDNLFMAVTLSTEESQTEQTEIYPNPFKNHISIETNSILKSIELYDVIGKKVISTDDKLVFETKAIALNSGVYILKLSDVNNRSITKKLIKQ